MRGSPNATVLGSLTGQKYEKETEINIPPCSHRQVSSSLLYSHISASVPHTTANLWTCSRPGLQVLLLLFPPPEFTSRCPPVLPNHFFSPAPTCQIFSPVYSAATATFLCAGWSGAKAGGSSWGRSCTRCFSLSYSRGSTVGAYEEVMLQNRKHFQMWAALVFFQMR